MACKTSGLVICIPIHSKVADLGESFASQVSHIIPSWIMKECYNRFKNIHFLSFPSEMAAIELVL